MTSLKMRDGRILLLVLALTTLVHVPALSTGYVYDDRDAILSHPDLSSPNRVGAIFLTNYWGTDRNIGLYRPLVQLTYLAEGATVGFVPAVSHAVNLLMHLVVVALLFSLLGALEIGAGPAGIAALVFGLHPALLDAAVWISGRTDVMAAGFLLAGLLVSLRMGERDGRPFSGPGWMLGFLYLCGLLSKEMAAPLPLLVLMLVRRRGLRMLPPLGLGLLAYLLLRGLAVEGFLPESTSGGVVLLERPIQDRVAIGSRALVRLLLLIPVPLGLAADHRADPLASGDAPTGPVSALSLAFLILLFVGGRRLARRHGGAGFLLSAVPVSLLPVLQIVPIGAVMAERFVYLPAAFLIGFLTWSVARFLSARGAVLAAAWGAVVVAAVITLQRIPVYRDGGTYFSDVVRAYPHDHEAWNNLGVFHWEKEPPAWHEAEQAFRRAVDALAEGSSRRYGKGTLNLTRLYLDWDRAHPSASLLRKAEETLSTLRRPRPEVFYLQGKIRARQARRGYGDPAELREEAFALHARAARMFAERGAASRRVAAAWKEAGLAARALGDDSRAGDAFRRARQADPSIALPQGYR